MNSRMLTKIGLIVFATLGIAGVARAWLRRSYSDMEVVSRAELIVIGRVKPGSVVLVPHDNKNRGAGWEHHVELLIDEVLKGQTSATSMVVSVHYGLDPVIGGYTSNQFRMLNAAHGRTNYPKDAIEIFDTGNSALSFTPITGDLRTNHVWLLRHLSPKERNHNDSEMIGIRDPEDIQPIRKRDELLRYLK
jgi:hypothetical protein